MYQKDTEAASPALAGEEPYADQVPLARAIPLWGAISSAGFHEIIYHPTKKLNQGEWKFSSNLVRDDKGQIVEAAATSGFH